MYDPTIHAKTIARHLQAADFIRDKSLFDSEYAKSLLERAVSVGTAGFDSISLATSCLRGKPVYQLKDLSDLLVIRHITTNIRRITSVKQDNRQFIVECIRTLLEDGTPFRVYKYDIKHFYESVRVDAIIAQLHRDVAFSDQSIRALSSFFRQLQTHGVKGLPRGLALSATLAEYLLRSLDHKIASHCNVWYYARFVDDILIIANLDQDVREFSEFANNALPPGLVFNEKSRHLPFTARQKGNSATDIEGVFDFLGYSFSVSKAFYRSPENKIARVVAVDISASKIKKLKTRVVRAILRYKEDNNYNDLLSRMRLLTSNFRFVDRASGAPRISGIYFNYPVIDAASGCGLDELDRFVRKAITSPHHKNRLRPTLTIEQKKAILNLTFRSGFEEKRFYAFKPKRLAELKSCWAYA
jgi:hypothetical protein